MQNDDLQQIKQLFKDNNEILDKKLDQKFKDNNKTLKEEIVDEVGVIFNQSFNELEAKIDLIDGKLNLVVDKDDKIAKKHQNFETEMAANVGAHDRLEKKFIETSGRAEVLEKKLGASRVAA